MQYTVKDLEKIVESIEPSEKKGENIEQLAARIADFIVMLTSAKHDATKEIRQEDAIQEQMLKVKDIEIRDTHNFLNLLKNAAISEVVKRDLWAKTTDMLKTLESEKELIEEVEKIIKGKKEEKYPHLKSLIIKILDKIREAEYKVQQDEKLLRAA